MQKILDSDLRRSLLLRTILMACASGALLACSSPPSRPPRRSSSGSSSTSPSRPDAAQLPSRAPSFIRPASGVMLARFDGNLNKGIDIAGAQGDPVIAAADGRVAVISSELRNYGHMVIVQHDNNTLTAYALLQNILVREKDAVRQGQQIAEIGVSAGSHTRLHFELRKQGIAVDPEPYLDGRKH